MKKNTNIPETGELTNFQKVLLVINWICAIGFMFYGVYTAIMKLSTWIEYRLDSMADRTKGRIKWAIMKARKAEGLDDEIDEVI